MASTGNSFDNIDNLNSRLFQTRQDKTRQQRKGDGEDHDRTLPGQISTIQNPYHSRLPCTAPTQHNTLLPYFTAASPTTPSDGRFPITTSTSPKAGPRRVQVQVTNGPLLTNAVSSSQPLGSSRILRPYSPTKLSHLVVWREVEYSISDILSVSLIPRRTRRTHVRDSGGTVLYSYAVCCAIEGTAEPRPHAGSYSAQHCTGRVVTWVVA